ncbi:MAG TPA: hypothetical protein VJ907_00815 [Halanaerobiales bacterium]|nr:hypothetical protein [Halanaerobiales bacterium]
MGLFDKIKSIFTPSSDSKIVKIFVKDKKCGNKIRVVLRKGYDIQRIYNEEAEGKYKIHKVIVCDKCYSNVVIDVKFDRNYNIIDKSIENGEFLTEEEYLEEQ